MTSKVNMRGWCLTHGGMAKGRPRGQSPELKVHFGVKSRQSGSPHYLGVRVHVRVRARKRVCVCACVCDVGLCGSVYVCACVHGCVVSSGSEMIYHRRTG